MKNLNTVFPFYQAAYSGGDGLAQQDKFKEYVDNERPLVCFDRNLLPFVIRRNPSTRTQADITFEIWEKDGIAPVVTLDATTYLAIDFSTDHTPTRDYDYIFHWGTTLPVTIPKGVYYVLINDNLSPQQSVTYYSDLFMVRPQAESVYYTKLKFWNETLTEFINEIPYGTGATYLHHTLYVNNLLRTPAYIREDTGDKVDNIVVLEKQVVQKQLKIYGMLMPEYLMDGLAILPLWDHLEIIEGNSGDCWTPIFVNMGEAEWIAEAKGAVAKLDMNFIRWSVVKKYSFIEKSCSCDGQADPPVLRNYCNSYSYQYS